MEENRAMLIKMGLLTPKTKKVKSFKVKLAASNVEVRRSARLAAKDIKVSYDDS